MPILAKYSNVLGELHDFFISNVLDSITPFFVKINSCAFEYNSFLILDLNRSTTTIVLAITITASKLRYRLDHSHFSCTVDSMCSVKSSYALLSDLYTLKLHCFLTWRSALIPLTEG